MGTNWGTPPDRPEMDPVTGRPIEPPPGQPPAPPPGWTPTGPMQPSYVPPPPKSKRSQWIRLGIIGVVAVVIVVAFALFSDRLTGSAADLQVGQCFDEPAGTTDISDVQRQPCNEAHDAEVFVIVKHTAGPGATYPPQTEFRDLAGEECVPAMESYVGMDIVALVAAGYDFSAFYPGRQGWDGGDRTVTCYAVRSDSSKMTSSIHGIGPGVSPSP